MQRRSERLRKPEAEQSTYNMDLSSDKDEDVEPPRKVQRTTSTKTKAGGSKPRRTRGKRGKLESINEMPLDILFEIFAHLSPAGLLHLSRTSKALRNILMHRSATYVWKNARSQIVGLPDCPNDLSEPQYANLIFFPYCHFCLKTHVPSQAIMWTTRTRSCKACTLENFVSDPYAFGVPLSIVPFIELTGTRYNKAYCWRTLSRYQAEMNALKSPALKEWILSKHTEYKARMEHAERCSVWNQNRTEERSNELESIRQRRYEAIKERLSDLGWGTEIAKLESEDHYEQLSEQKLVRQPRDLTERIWGNIKTTLIDFMQKRKAYRIDMERRAMIRKRGRVLSEVLKNYASTQQLHAILPPVADVAILTSFRAVIEDTPIEEEVLETHFKEAMVDFPQVVETWRNSKDAELIKMMKARPEIGAEAKESTLRLATIFFRCTCCAREISYPRILVHKCTTYIGFLHRDDPYFRDLSCSPWNMGDNVQFDHRAYRRARLVLRDCGFDPDSLTSASLNSLDPRFECRKCMNPQEGRLLMRWPAVVKHTMGHYDSEEVADVVQVPTFEEHEGLLAELLEYAQMSPVSGHWAHTSWWICIECKRQVPWRDSLDHLNQLHPEAIPEGYSEGEHARHFDRHFTLHLDALQTPLFRPIRVNMRNPAHSFRKVFAIYQRLYNNAGGGHLDMLSQQMAEVFLAGPSTDQQLYNNTGGHLDIVSQQITEAFLAGPATAD